MAAHAKLSLWVDVALAGALTVCSWSPVLASDAAPSPAVGAGTASSAILTDTARPIEAGKLKADELPQISVQFVPGTVDPQTVRLIVNQVDVSAQAEIDALGVRFTPQRPLPEGRQHVQVQIGEQQHSWSFLTASPPQVTAIAPDETTLPSGARPVITAQFADVGSGVDVSRTRLIISGGQYDDDVDVTSQAEVSASSIKFVPAQPLQDDIYFVDVRVFDHAGNIGLGHSRSTFQVGGAPQILEVEPGPDEVVLPYGTPRLLRARFNSGAYPLLGYEMGVGLTGTVEPQFEDHGDGTYTLSYLMAETSAGRECFHVAVWNTKTLRASEIRCFSIDIERRREIEILAPAPDAEFAQRMIEVRVRASENERAAADVLINGRDASVQRDASSQTRRYQYHYDEHIRLKPGANLIDIEVRFDNGAVERRQLRVFRTTAASATKQGPADAGRPHGDTARDGAATAVPEPKAWQPVSAAPSSKHPTVQIVARGCERSSADARELWIEAAFAAAQRLIPEHGIEQVRLDCTAQKIVVDLLIPDRLRARPAALFPGQQTPPFPGPDYCARVAIERTTGRVLQVFGS